MLSRNKGKLRKISVVRYTMNQQEWFPLSTVNVMRTEILTCKKELKHFKKLHSESCQENKKLKLEILKLKKSNAKLKNYANSKKLAKLEASGKCKTYRKRSPRKTVKLPKLQRVQDYKPFLQGLTEGIPNCKDISMSLNMGEQDIRVSFCKTVQAQEKPVEVAAEEKGPDHTYCNKPMDVDPEVNKVPEIPADSIYDSDGNFTKAHIRKAVLVTDAFRISNDAYHEIRTELAGHMPPIGKVKFEKGVMSEEIPYQKHPTVSFYQFIILTNF